MTDTHPTVKVILAIVERRLQSPFSLDGLSRAEADLLATVTAYGVIGNGGLVYWYEGKSSRITHKVATSFERLGLPAVADALRASLRAFPGEAPPEDLKARSRYISAHRAELEDAFRDLEKVVWNADWDSAAMAYIDSHRAELASIAPEYAAALRLQ